MTVLLLLPFLNSQLCLFLRLKQQTLKMSVHFPVNQNRVYFLLYLCFHWFINMIIVDSLLMSNFVHCVVALYSTHLHSAYYIYTYIYISMYTVCFTQCYFLQCTSHGYADLTSTRYSFFPPVLDSGLVIAQFVSKVSSLSWSFIT